MENNNTLITKSHKFWLLVSALFIGLIWMFSSVFIPFFLGFIIAYMLTPLADKLEKIGFHRMIGTNIVLFVFLVAITLFGWLFIPIIISQLSDLIASIPEYSKKIITFAKSNLSNDFKEIFLDSIQEIDYQEYIGQALGDAAGVTKNIFKHIISGSMGIVSVVTSIIIALVTAFYLIYDWHTLLKIIDEWFPRKHQETIRGLVKKVDYLQSSFIRGQGTVCLIMASYYIIIFGFIGIENGFVLGLTTGILTFIPYVGASIGFLMTIGIALAQYLPDYTPLIMIAVTFAIGQTIEGYVLVPQMVGGAVSMHPVWIMFALLAFGSLFGIAGMLIAVPVTAALGVMIKFILEHYMLSEYYRGT